MKKFIKDCIRLNHNRNKATSIKLTWTLFAVSGKNTSKISFQITFEENEGKSRKTTTNMDQTVNKDLKPINEIVDGLNKIDFERKEWKRKVARLIS